MAEEPIRKEDIFDFDGTQQGIENIMSLLKQVSTLIHKDIIEEAQQLIKTVQGGNVASKEYQATLTNVAKEVEGLSAKDKELTRLERERLSLQAKLKTSTSDLARGNVQLKVELENQNRANKENVKLMGSAQNSVNAMRARLKELTTEYNRLSGSARKEVAPSINKLTNELKKAESAIGNNTRNVGNYSSALSGLPGPLGMAVTGMQRLITASKAFIATPIGAVIAAVAAVLGTLTAWFKRSEDGQNSLNTVVKTFGVILNNILDIAGDVGEAIFGIFKNLRSVFTGDKSLKEALHDTGQGFKEVGTNVKNLISETKEEMKLARELAELENSNIRRTREWGVEKAKIDAKIAALREDAEKRDEATAEQRIKLIDEALALEEKVYQTEKKLAEERLKIQRGFNAMSDSNREDKQKEADLEIALINLQTQRDLMQRTMEAKRQSLLREAQKELKSREKIELEKVSFDRQIIDQRINELKRFTGFSEEEIKKRVAAEIQITEEAERRKQEIISGSFSAISSSLNTISALYEANKQRELSAAGDNAQKREEIERKYAKKQQILSIGQALINGAMAVMEIQKKWAAFPVIAGIFTGLTVASTLAQVAIIKAQKFAKGGSGVLFGPTHSSGGINVGIGEAEGGEHIAITSRKMTSRYGAKMLDAVSNSINQGKFFEVWANVNKEMGVSDPYTKKMYDLMTKTPTVYTDTNGNTVKEYPNGQKYVIKKFWNN
jgi:hypothetical protein